MTSSWFPYAQPLPRDGLNYIRNSVKIVIDAYNGTVDFYVADASDAIIETYRRIFPGLFKSFEVMPADLKKHVRYPEDFFHIQALMYRAYHMDAPEVFYNREDLWQFPRRPRGFNAEEMEPYYIIHQHAPAGRDAHRVFPDAPDGAEPAPKHDRMAGRPLRSAGLWEADCL